MGVSSAKPAREEGKGFALPVQGKAYYRPRVRGALRRRHLHRIRATPTCH